MSVGSDALRERRDQALRDLVELESQVERGEIPAVSAAPLRRRYEAEAVGCLEALEAAHAAAGRGGGGPGGDGAGGAAAEGEAGEATAREPREREALLADGDPDGGDPPDGDPDGGAHREGTASRGRRWLSARSLPYVAAGIIALLAGAVLLPQYVDSRPEGGFITGNEPIAGQLDDADSASGSGQPPPEPGELSVAEMEDLVADSPAALGIRLTLANRYIDRDEHDRAAEHLGEVLLRDPGNPRAMSFAGWSLHQQDEHEAALHSVERALAVDPQLPEALWFQANILLDGHDDADGALEALDTLNEHDELDPQLRADAEELAERAQDESAQDESAQDESAQDESAQDGEVN